MQLFETGTGCTFGNFYSEYTPVLMSINSEKPAYLMLDMGVAFVNPFTENPREAVEFLEEIADALSDTLMYCLDPTLDQPIRYAYYEKEKASLEAELTKMKAEYESADAVDKQSMEADIRGMEESLEMFENYGWSVSQRDIDWYRANDDNIAITPVNWLYSEAAGGEAAELMQQYMDGQIDVGQMLSGIDRKVQMMRMEGN